MIIFAPHNVISDAPFTRMDLVCCRNLLIYFSPELQKKVLPIFHYSLNPGGTLLLGTSETVSGFNDLFAVLDSKWRTFQRKDLPSKLYPSLEFPSAQPCRAAKTRATTEEAGLSISDLAKRILMDDYTPPAVLINQNGDVLFVNGRTGKYLEPSPGKADMNVHTMAREGLRYELAGAVRKAYAERAPVGLTGVCVKTDGNEQVINLTVKPIDKLAHTKERLRTNVEEMEASQEELQAANEELQSANEELQSTFETILPDKTEFSNYTVEHQFPSIGQRKMILNARQMRMRQGQAQAQLILLAIDDITGQN